MINSVTKQKFLTLVSEAGMGSYYNFFVFEKSREDSAFDRIKIAYAETEYYFSFTDNPWTSKTQEYNCRWSPDKETNSGSSKVETLDLVLIEFQKWLKLLKPNLEIEGRII